MWRIPIPLVTATVLALLSVAHAAPLVVTDDTLDLDDYEYHRFDHGPVTGSVTITHHPTGGNADAWLGILIAPSGYQIDTVFFRKGVLYDPAGPDGPLAAITHEEDAVCLPYDSIPRPCQATGPALRQDDHIFIAPFNPDFVTTSWPLPVWSKFRRTFEEADFVRVAGCDSNGCSPTVPAVRTQPDFSAAGPPIEVGFFRAKSGGVDSEAGIDNWRLQTHPFCTMVAECDDGDDCTLDACDATVCTATPIDGCAAPALAITNRDDDHTWGTNPVIPYTITVSNGSDTVRSGLVVTDVVPERTVFQPPPASDAAWSCTAPDAGGVCTAALPDLPPGESATLTFTVRVEDGTDPAFEVFNLAATNPAAAECTPGRAIECGCTVSEGCHECPLHCSGCQYCESDCAPACARDPAGKLLNPITCQECSLNCGNCSPSCVAACQGCVVDCRGQPSTPEELSGCCYAKVAVCLVGLCPSLEHELCPQASGILRARGAGGPPPGYDSAALYRVRDRVFASTAGGRQATALYYRHSTDLVRATFETPALVLAAQQAFAAWYEHLQTLAADEEHGTQTADMAVVSAEQVAALVAFLDATRRVAVPALAGAIDRGRARLGLDGWAGLSLSAALARLEDLACPVAPTLASVGCRIGDAMAILEGDVPPSAFAGKLRVALAKATSRIVAAATAGDDRKSARRARRFARKAARLVAKTTRRVRSKRGARAIADAAVQARLADALQPLPGELKTILR